MERNSPSPAASVTPEGQTRGDAVYEGLKARILGHDFRMGTPLREDEVAGWFGASRLPAREALKRLELEGLVERLGRKYAIRAYSFPEILVTYRIRAALEHLAVDLACAQAGEEDLARIAAVLDQQAGALRTASRGEFSELDSVFHLGLARIGRNPALLRELEVILNRVRLIRSNEIDVDSGPPGAYADHCRIFEALRRRDAATARAELDYHYSTTLRLHRLAAPETTTGPAT
ncbi:GntR family transcriptional regulator (plasmid) [Paroceanicella profunda]|uniref:GntR family transcriptional regulator n=1 Tax=Paroceanicella profunda TaxID=2579971 RepID=A0A5B8G694_9RHOB|nr:GntR family transcriptional regulator [Paroceanicella profunda]QDL94623.1 GntR family transcriptional regulator [Paroceanicella profunda]